MKNSLIKLTKTHLYHLYPHILGIDIKMERLHNNRFKSKIALKTKAKSFISDKEDEGYSSSLEKAYQAISKQLEKMKVNKIHEQHHRLVFEDETPEELLL